MATADRGLFPSPALRRIRLAPLTVLCALAAVARLLAGKVPPGLSTPTRAFGNDFIASIPVTDLQFEEANSGLK